MAEEKKEKTTPVAVGMDVDRIRVLQDIVEAGARIRGPVSIPINSLAMYELAQHSKAAEEELAEIAKKEAEERAAEEAKRVEEEKKRLKEEEEANQPAKVEAQPSPAVARRELPPLTPPPAR